MNKDISSDYIVGKITALSMYISILFLFLQVLVWIPCMIIIILVENNAVSQPQSGLSCLITFLFSESIIVWRIIIHIKKKYLPFELTVSDKQGGVKPFIFKEQYMETALNITAGAGILWILLLGVPFSSIRYLLIVIQGFGILFFTIFFVVRLLVTKKLAIRTLFSLLLSFASVWLAIS